jgi:hemolysin activation/secretion protein
MFCLICAAHAQVASAPITQFTVTGNTLLAPKLIDATLARHAGASTLEQLKAAAQAVQQLYTDAGYGGVVAYVPEQTGQPGRATIAVLEGRIARVNVVGNSRFSEDNIRRSVPQLAVGSTPQVHRSDAQFQLANESPSKQLSVSLAPGTPLGEFDARVLVGE